MSDQSTTNLEPNLDMLPKSLRCLDWQPMGPEEQFYDGDSLLVAVAVCWPKGRVGRSCVKQITQNNKDWYYELSVITVSCDEHYFAVVCNDEPWGWELSDVEFFVRIK